MALYQCPTCGNRFTQMQCLKFLSRGAMADRMRFSARARTLTFPFFVSVLADQQFVCPHCCPGEVSRTMSQPSFKLVQVDNDAALAAANAMIEKCVVVPFPPLLPSQPSSVMLTSCFPFLKTRIEYQFGQQGGEHDGIHELLEELKDKPLIRNLPSDNMKSGLTNTAVTDAVRDCCMFFFIVASGSRSQLLVWW